MVMNSESYHPALQVLSATELSKWVLSRISDVGDNFVPEKVRQKRCEIILKSSYE